MITPKLITAAVTLPVSVAEAKSKLRITHSDSDTLIENEIGEASDIFAWLTGRSFHQQTLEMYWDRFPSGGKPMHLPRATPLVSVTYVKYKDSGGTEYTWTDTEYVLDTVSVNPPGSIRPAYGESYPSFVPFPVNAVWARYVAGIATASPVTELEDGLKKTLLDLVVYMHEHPGLITLDTLTKLPYGLQLGINQYRVRHKF